MMVQRRAQVGVELEFLAQPHVRRAVAAARGRFERALQREASAADAVERGGRQRVARGLSRRRGRRSGGPTRRAPSAHRARRAWRRRSRGRCRRRGSALRGWIATRCQLLVLDRHGCPPMPSDSLFARSYHDRSGERHVESTLSPQGGAVPASCTKPGRRLSVRAGVFCGRRGIRHPREACRMRHPHEVCRVIPAPDSSIRGQASAGIQVTASAMRAGTTLKEEA